MLLPMKDMTGKQTGEIELSDAVFGAPVLPQVMHQALVRQLSNARLGTHKTKTRGEVAGGGRKPWRQKGTGRARQGSIRAPQWVGGGTVFGPTPHKYYKAMPKKMQRAALRSALSVKASAGQIVVVDKLATEQPKTKTMTTMLQALGIADESVLVVLAEKDMAVVRSLRNLPKVKTLLSGYLNIRDLLGYDHLLLSRDAVDMVELWLGEDVENRAAPHEPAKPAATAPAIEAPAVPPPVVAASTSTESDMEESVEEQSAETASAMTEPTSTESVDAASDVTESAETASDKMQSAGTEPNMAQSTDTESDMMESTSTESEMTQSTNKESGE
jgi:large subunit ribosomal protein L4